MTTHTPSSSGAEPSGEATPEPVQAYIDRIACEHRPLFDRLHRFIRTAQPDAHPESPTACSATEPTPCGSTSAPGNTACPSTAGPKGRKPSSLLATPS
jgi:hypothetical protein